MNDAQVKESVQDFVARCRQRYHLRKTLGSRPEAAIKQIILELDQGLAENVELVVNSADPMILPGAPAEAVGMVTRELIKACGFRAIHWAEKEEQSPIDWPHELRRRLPEAVEGTCDDLEKSSNDLDGLRERLSEVADWGNFLDVFYDEVLRRFCNSYGPESFEEADDLEDPDGPLPQGGTTKAERQEQLRSIDDCLKQLGGLEV